MKGPLILMLVLCGICSITSQEAVDSQQEAEKQDKTTIEADVRVFAKILKKIEELATQNELLKEKNKNLEEALERLYNKVEILEAEQKREWVDIERKEICRFGANAAESYDLEGIKIPDTATHIKLFISSHSGTVSRGIERVIRIFTKKKDSASESHYIYSYCYPQNAIDCSSDIAILPYNPTNKRLYVLITQGDIPDKNVMTKIEVVGYR